MKACFVVLAIMALAVEGSFDKATAAYNQASPDQANFCFYFSGDGDPTAGGKQQAPKKGCFQQDTGCKNCLVTWHQFPPDSSYAYGPILTGGCNGTKSTLPFAKTLPPGLTFYQWF